MSAFYSAVAATWSALTYYEVTGHWLGALAAVCFAVLAAFQLIPDK